MIDWSQPRPLSKVTEDAGFTMSDVAFVSGLDESTVSRLWDDPRWLDRVSGRSLQSLAASVPGVAEYFASHSLLARRNSLVKQLQAEGLVVNRPALLLSAGTEVPHQYLINALEAALTPISTQPIRPSRQPGVLSLSVSPPRSADSGRRVPGALVAVICLPARH